MPPSKTRTVRILAPGDRVVVCGAGPAGLTGATLLARRGHRVCVLESDGQVGGLARTVRYKGFRFDIGGHRFFTKIPEVEAFWNDVLGPELIDVPRLSRIHYRGKLFHYPLQAADAVRGLGFWQAVLIVLSYVRAQLLPHRVEESFEQWVSNRFGDRLYRIFFKTYTEKVWGMPCTEIRAEWAAQRIQGLSLVSAIVAATSLQRRSNGARTMIREFKYPRLGPGQMWERCADLLCGLGGEVRLDHEVTGFELAGGRITAAYATTPAGEQRFEGEHFLTTMPLDSLVRALGPAVPEPVQAAAAKLAYRDFVLVSLILDKAGLFPDNWIYVHTPGVRVGRVQNFNNWSPALVPDPAKTCLGMEYFCSRGDELWELGDRELIALASRELEALDLAPGAQVVDGTVVRMPKAYPIYDSTYRNHLETIRSFIDTIPNLHTVGRNGMHKYNNQDHSMYTAMLAVENLEGAAHDLWAVNTDFDYHEVQRIASPAASPRTPAPLRPRFCPGHPALSVIIPVRDGADHLPASLGALRASDLPSSRWELIVVDDSSRDRSPDVSAGYADRVVRLMDGPHGPAFARNRGAEVARGDVLAFVDADVCVHPDALRRVIETFEREPDVSAVFGAYDLAPAASGLISQYRNLLHRYVHQRDAGDAVTFWGGCGAVLAEAFHRSGGFDEARYGTASIEDIELGYRMSALGHRIVLRPEIQGRHLKRWTLGSMVRTDVWQRGIPWVHLLMSQPARPERTLNIRPMEQACTALVVVGCIAFVAWVLSGAAGWLAISVTSAGAMLAINGPLFAWFARQRGWSFALRVVPLRLLYYALNAVSVCLALASFRFDRGSATRGYPLSPGRERLPRPLAGMLAPIDRRAFGAALGTVGGLGVFLLTVADLLRHPDQGFSLALLGQYFPGYAMSWTGAVVGLAWGFGAGFVAGWFLAFIRNLGIAVWILVARSRYELAATHESLDHT